MHPWWDASPLPGTMHTHSHILLAIPLIFGMILEGGMKPGDPEETHTDIGRTSAKAATQAHDREPGALRQQCYLQCHWVTQILNNYMPNFPFKCAYIRWNSLYSQTTESMDSQKVCCVLHAAYFRFHPVSKTLALCSILSLSINGFFFFKFIIYLQINRIMLLNVSI